MPIVHGPPTPEGPAAGAAQPINADCPPVEEDKLPPKQILSNETTWYTNRVLKFSGDINYYKNSTPKGYDRDVDYEKKDTFKSTKEEKKKDQIDINKRAKKLAKNSIHKNVDMEEIEKVEDRKEEKGIKWVCNKTVEAKEDEAEEWMAYREAADDIVGRENDRMSQALYSNQLNQRSHLDYNYLNQWNNREYEVPQVHATLTQRDVPHSSWSEI
jgi:hypothetical protein